MESGGIPKAAGAAVQAGGLSLPALLIISVSQMRKLSPREVKCFIQSHAASQGQSWASNQVVRCQSSCSCKWAQEGTGVAHVTRRRWDSGPRGADW